MLAAPPDVRIVAEPIIEGARVPKLVPVPDPKIVRAPVASIEASDVVVIQPTGKIRQRACPAAGDLTQFASASKQVFGEEWGHDRRPDIELVGPATRAGAYVK